MIFKAVIPKGTFLYRKAKTNAFDKVMFFGFDTTGIDTAKYKTDSIQLWKTQIDIQSNFLVMGRYKSGRFKSSIPELYDLFGGDKSLCNGQIKSSTNESREFFLSFLNSEYNIQYWITPVDSGEPMEFCIFCNNIKKQVEFVEYLQSDEQPSQFNKVKIIDDYRIPLITANNNEGFIFFK